MGTASVIGIDLGTTYSCVGALDNSGKPYTVVNSEGDLTTPSVVFFDRAGVIVGKEAAQAGEFEPERLAQFFKRDMGESEYSKEIHGISLPPEVLQGLILRKLKQDTELKLGPVSQAVITVPAFFNEPCRKATMDAGRLAGLDVLDIINEPTAAAITYGVQKGFLDRDGRSLANETILVYDLGGGTFDVTLMQIDGVRYEAIATAGDVYLGGIDWDRRIADEIAERFQHEHKIDPREDAIGLQRLLQQARDVKHALTAREQMNVFFRHNDVPFRTLITRAELEDLTGDLLDRTMMTVRDVLRDTGKGWSDISRLLVVGGSSRMPMVTEMLARESGLEVDRSLSPDEAIAHGAAVYAGLLNISAGRPMTGFSVSNVNSHDLGVLGIESATGRPFRQVMIPRNTTLPASATKPFKTARDGQRSVKVEIVEGGDDAGFGATAVGKCAVRDLPPGLKAGTPVEVSFDYATNGRLTVRAYLPTLGHDAVLTLDRVAGLPEEAIQEWLARIDAGLTDELLAELNQWTRDQANGGAPTESPVVESGPTPIVSVADLSDATPIPPSASLAATDDATFPGINTGELPDDDPLEAEPAFPSFDGLPSEAKSTEEVIVDIGVEAIVEPVEEPFSIHVADNVAEATPVVKKLAPADQGQTIRKLSPQSPVKKLTPLAAPKKLAPIAPVPPAYPPVPVVGPPPEAPVVKGSETTDPVDVQVPEAPAPAAGDWKSRRKKLAPGE